MYVYIFVFRVLNDPVLEVKALCNLSHALTMNKCFERAIDDAMTVIKAAPTLSNAVSTVVCIVTVPLTFFILIKHCYRK